MSSTRPLESYGDIKKDIVSAKVKKAHIGFGVEGLPGDTEQTL
jgi:hypothetical protein